MTIAGMSALLTKPGAGRVQQTLGEIVAVPVSVREFGAKGDGTANDGPAINAAIASGRAIYFPAGTYLSLEDIIYTTNTPPVFIGEHHPENSTHMAQIRDGRDAPIRPLISHELGYMLPSGTYSEGVPIDASMSFTKDIRISNMCIRSTKGPFSSCLDILKARSYFLDNCLFIYSFRGVTQSNWTFDNVVFNCSFQGAFFTPGYGDHEWPEDRDDALLAWGIYSPGHTSIFGFDCVGSGVAGYLTGVNISVIGGRLEVNGYGLYLGGTGLDIEGATASRLSRSKLAGLSFEANAVALAVKHLDSSVVEACGIQGSPANLYASRPHDSECGIIIEQMTPSAEVRQIAVGGYYSRAAVINNSTRALDGVTATNSSGTVLVGGQTQPLGAGTADPAYHFRNSIMFPGAEQVRHRTITAFHDLMLPGLTGLNVRDVAAEGGAIFAKNLGGVAAPAAEATTVDVVFQGSLGTGTIAFQSSATREAAESALEPGTYVYATTCVAQHAETSVYLPQTVEVEEGEEVVLKFYGTSAPVIRRIYRAGADGFYAGYWDQSGHADFVDDGSRPFDGLGTPPTAGIIPSRAEDDANYQILATPSWATTVHVTARATTGFTLNFGTAAPDGSQTVAWLMFRP